VCTFLVSDHAASITGDVIVADGGFGLNQLRLG
jgi:enoyl-[acyl-carrier-protein] reductase (NADH)